MWCGRPAAVLGGAVSERLDARGAALWVLLGAFPWRSGLLVVLCGLAGAVPGLFALAVGSLIGTIPAAAEAGLDSPGSGRVVEQGSHAALLERNGRYARLFRLQAAAVRD